MKLPTAKESLKDRAMKRTDCYLSFLLTILCVLPVFSQDDKIIPASPKAQTLLRYGEIPVGYQTGVPDITIPLYTIKSHDIEVPITLSYHIRNVRPGYDPSDIGLGWTLNFGGQISRSIYGVPDDVVPDPPVKYSFEQLDQSSYEQINYLHECVSGNVDTEHDIFNISSTLLNGNFILERKAVNDYIPHLMTFSNLKLKIKTSPQTLPYSKSLITGIDILDGRGIKYEFGNNMVETVLALDSKYTITTWLLQKITDASGQYSVNYRYTKIPQYSVFNTQNRIVSILGDHVKEVTIGVSNKSRVPFRYSCDGSDFHDALKRDGMLISEIVFPSGRILFDIDASKNEIYGFKVLDNENREIRRISFVKSSFSHTLSSYIHKKLDAVRISGSSNKEADMAEYRFSYNEDIMDSHLWGTDFWGYYNETPYDCTKRDYNCNITDFNSSVNGHPASQADFAIKQITIGSSERIPSLKGSLCETLNKIIYPAKGETEFEYELNTCSNSQITNKTVGGLRIKRIKNKAQDGKQEIIDYHYEQGEIDHNYSYHSNFCTTSYILSVNRYGDNMLGNDYLLYRNRIYTNGLSGELGNNEVRYGKVSEVFSDGINHYGKNVYYFEKPIRNDYLMYVSGIEGDEGKYVIWNKKDENSGFLCKKEIYKRNAQGEYLLVRKETNNWEYFPNRTPFKNYKAFRLVTFIENNSNLATEWHFYERLRKGQTYAPVSFQEACKMFGLYQYNIITGRVVNLGTTITTYSENSAPVSIETTYRYDNPLHNNPTSISTVSSVGRKMVTTTMYPSDYTSASMVELINKNIQSPVSTITYVNGKMTKGFLTKYNGSGQPLEIFQAERELGTSFAIDKNSPYNWGKLKTQFTYLPNSNVVQSHHTGGIVQDVCYLWSYNSTYPIAEIRNATFSDIISMLGGTSAVINFANRKNPTINEIQAFLTPVLSNPKYMVTYYSYKPLVGMASRTGPNGVTTHYEYDSFSRLYKERNCEGKVIRQYHYQFKSLK
uniref:YD repeat-containing protein n=1 Tax=Prevotella sp. GTC17262 TaxID=3236797 RepID=A0AB33JL79_9BACT